jgi:hypothetical protein
VERCVTQNEPPPTADPSAFQTECRCQPPARLLPAERTRAAPPSLPFYPVASCRSVLHPRGAASGTTSTASEVATPSIAPSSIRSEDQQWAGAVSFYGGCGVPHPCWPLAPAARRHASCTGSIQRLQASIPWRYPPTQWGSDSAVVSSNSSSSADGSSS